MQRKEYSMNLKIKKMFSNEIIEEQYYVLGYYTDLAFPVHKLGIEIDENSHMDRSKAKEKERQKTIEKETGFTIIRINPDREGFQKKNTKNTKLHYRINQENN